MTRVVTSLCRLCVVAPGSSIASVLLRVDADRLRADFDALAAIGATADGGVDRGDVLGRASRRARLVPRAGRRRRARDEDRRRREPLGRPAARDPAARTLLLGSHLDSVRRGGRFDGALGVVCALEVLRAVQGRRARASGHARGDRLHRRGGDADRHARQPGARRAADRADLAAPRCGRELLVAELARMGLTKEGSSARAATPPRSPATWSCTSSRGRCSSRQASISGSSPASSERLVHGGVRG